MKDELVSYKSGLWCCYVDDSAPLSIFENNDNVGKFTTYGKGDLSDEVQELIIKAIRQGVTPLIKHDDIDTLDFNPRSNNGSWVICWYSTDEKRNLKKIAKFLADHGLIATTKSGRYYNISFK